jgi:hypothetical protein
MPLREFIIRAAAIFISCWLLSLKSIRDELHRVHDHVAVGIFI